MRLTYILSLCIFVSVSSYPLGVTKRGDKPSPANSADCNQTFTRRIFKSGNTDYRLNDVLSSFDQLSDDCRNSIFEDIAFSNFISIERESLMHSLEEQDLLNPQEVQRFYRELLREAPPQDLVERINQSNEQVRSACTGVDHRSELPPVRSQYEVGWCYAYAAADLVSHRLGRAVSAVDIALGYNYQNNMGAIRKGIASAINFNQRGIPSLDTNRLLETIRGLNDLTILVDCEEGQTCFNDGGWPARAIESRQNAGFCLEEDLPSDGYEGTTLGEIITTADELDNWAGQFDSEDPIAFARDICASGIGLIITQGFPNALLSDISDILHSYVTTNSYAYLAEQSCQGSRVQLEASPIHQRRSEFEGKYGALNQVDELLTRGDIVGFSYPTTLLGVLSENSELHASTLVGRRWNQETNSCQYLIRNSWGMNCHPAYRNAGLECDQGNIWVERRDLAENMGTIQYFESSP